MMYVQIEQVKNEALWANHFTKLEVWVYRNGSFSLKSGFCASRKNS